jgi:hypothetical protein
VVAEPDEAGDEWFGVARDPPVVDLANRYRVEVMAFGSPDPLGGEEVGIGQDDEVLHHTEPRHRRQRCDEFVHRLSVSLAELIEEVAAARICECFEHIVHMKHNT